MDIESLFAQTVEGDLESVRQQLDATPFLLPARNSDADAWDQQTLLHAASKHGHLEIVKLLVERGAALD